LLIFDISRHLAAKRGLTVKPSTISDAEDTDGIEATASLPPDANTLSGTSSQHYTAWSWLLCGRHGNAIRSDYWRPAGGAFLIMLAAPEPRARGDRSNRKPNYSMLAVGKDEKGFGRSAQNTQQENQRSGHTG